MGGSMPEPLIEVDRAVGAIRELHGWLLEHGFLHLERYPWPGQASSLYHDPAVWYRFVTGQSNCWQPSAFTRIYHTWLWRTQPALWLLCRAFLLCRPVMVEALEQQFGPAQCRSWLEAGLLTLREGAYASRVRATPWRGRILWHDAPPNFRAGFAFLGADSVMFAHHLLRWRAAHATRRIDRALDLCTGTGIHALWLSEVADEVVGTDINPRALAYARLNAALQGAGHITFAEADLFTGAPRGPYDLVICNGPLLFLPDELRERCVDGNGGAFGIELMLRLVDGLTVHLASGGTALLHANSPFIDGHDMLEERLRERLAGGRWRVTFTPTHEFHDATFYDFYRAHRIQRFVTYCMTLEAGPSFQWRREHLVPWRKAACGLRIAGVRSFGEIRRHLRPDHTRTVTRAV